MASTYELLALGGRILDGLLELETDEAISGLLAEQIDSYMEGLPQKVERLYYVQKRASAESKLLQEEAARLMARANACGKIEARVKDMAKDLLLSHESLTSETKLKTPTVTAWLQMSSTVMGPVDVEQWPEDLVTTRVTKAPDKIAARARLKLGEEIEGVYLMPSVGIRWR